MPLLGSFGEYKLIFQLVLLQSKGTYPMYTSLWRTCRAHQLTNVTKIDLEKSMYIHSIVLHLHLKS